MPSSPASPSHPMLGAVSVSVPCVGPHVLGKEYVTDFATQSAVSPVEAFGVYSFHSPDQPRCRIGRDHSAVVPAELYESSPTPPNLASSIESAAIRLAVYPALPKCRSVLDLHPLVTALHELPDVAPDLVETELVSIPLRRRYWQIPMVDADSKQPRSRTLS